jgi:hypothetical protein
MVAAAVRPVVSSSSTSTTGAGSASQPGSAGSSRCSVAWLWASSNVPAGANPGTARRVECR